jgi:eukaryotic-like serine/threonine-protein kinase
MTVHWLCPHGHTGEGAGSRLCPVCGSPCEPSQEGTQEMPGADTTILPPAQPHSDLMATLAYPASADPPPVTALVPGYEVQGELGRGGMGVVYKARHTRLNRTVALKMILSGAHAGRMELQRFRLEAEAVAQLQHPHIVQVYDVGESEGRAFLALEFVDGGSLAQHLLAGPLPPEEAAKTVATLARAMDHAHQQQILHRDLKPGNVLLTHDGSPKITDFGLAKKLSDNSGLTASQAIMGTPSYMAPEQAAGKNQELSPAADVYALGAILYECLTGRPPFLAETPLDTIIQLTTEEVVPPRRLAPRCPRDLETICLKCLEKSPRKRYASAGELADDLERHLAGEAILARPVGLFGRFTRWCARQPAFATTLIGLSLFYANHLVLIRVGIEDEGGDFHWFVTGVLLSWVLGAWGFQRLLRRPAWNEVGLFAWASMDVLFFSLLLWRGHGPGSSLVGGYLVLTAAAALRFRGSLVWFVTGLSMFCYSTLAVEALLNPAKKAVEPHRCVIFLLFLAMMGMICNLLLRRGRAAGQGS